MISLAQEPAWLDWASEVLKVKFDPSAAAWIARLRGDATPHAVVVYTRFSPFNCEMSIASDGDVRWGSREFMRVCYSYPFIQCNLNRITVVVEEDNERSLVMCRKLGHVQEGVLKQWFGTKDGIVFRMLKEECRWIR